MPNFLAKICIVLTTMVILSSCQTPPVMNCGSAGAPWSATWAPYWQCFNQYMAASAAFCRQYGTTKADGSCVYGGANGVNSNGGIDDTDERDFTLSDDKSGERNILHRNASNEGFCQPYIGGTLPNTLPNVGYKSIAASTSVTGHYSSPRVKLEYTREFHHNSAVPIDLERLFSGHDDSGFRMRVQWRCRMALDKMAMRT
ncbi:hypothetical protein Fcan01_25348, partial [Folsomia candida]